MVMICRWSCIFYSGVSKHLHCHNQFLLVQATCLFQAAIPRISLLLVFDPWARGGLTVTSLDSAMILVA